jgi:hypothetical protein
MAQNEDQKNETVPTDDATAQPEAELSATLEFWASRNAYRDVEGLRVPARELMAGFVHQMRNRNKLVAKPSEFDRLWKRFQKE